MTHKFRKSVFRSRNAVQTLAKLLATLLAILFQPLTRQRESLVMRPQGMSLQCPGGRKYLNESERERFLRATSRQDPKTRLFCLLLLYAGCRISEALAVTPSSIDCDTGVATFETLKRRIPGVTRDVPLPPSLMRDLDREFGLRAAQKDESHRGRRLWRWSRTTAWRRVKAVMAKAGVHGTAAMPKGLRHAFGVRAFWVVPPHLVQRWLGHASLRTTAIYGDVSGPEERKLASRMWS
jgi:integrase/recombinase XerD